MTVKNLERNKMEKREFSFRVWHEKKEYMYDNVAIGLMDKILYLRGSPKKKGADWYVSEDVEDSIVIMQCIGLRDDKKRKVFEGDVVKVGAQEKVGKVIWNSETIKFEVEFIDEKKIIDFSDKRSLRQLQVIGNIYENPELVGGEQRSNPKNIDYDLDVTIADDTDDELEE
jgi:uncharacterized phage protein (TIGR01671 family)